MKWGDFDSFQIFVELHYKVDFIIKHWSLLHQQTAKIWFWCYQWFWRYLLKQVGQLSWNTLYFRPPRPSTRTCGTPDGLKTCPWSQSFPVPSLVKIGARMWPCIVNTHTHTRVYRKNTPLQGRAFARLHTQKHTPAKSCRTSILRLRGLIDRSKKLDNIRKIPSFLWCSQI